MSANTNSRNNEQKFLIAAVLGSMLEFFNFLIFVLLSPIIAQLFFPDVVPHLGKTYVYLIIAVSYLFRPFGGIIIGALSDKFGRKIIFVSSILLMALPSLVIAILPPFAKIGYLSTLIIIIARILQGISLGVEFPNSITFVVEKYRKTNYYFFCAWLTFGANLGIAISSQFIHLLTKYTTHEFMITYGWRIPFFLGSFLAFIAFYLRRIATESDEFLRSQNKQANFPLWQVIKSYKTQIFCGSWIALVISSSTAIFHVFLPNLLVDNFAFSLTTAVNVSSMGALTLAIFSVVFAYLTKYLNPGSIIFITGIGLIISLGFIMFYSIDLNIKNDFNLIYVHLIVIIVSLFLSGINGIFLGLLADLFPPQARCSGVSICYNIAYILGAGLTPLWANNLLVVSGDFRYIVAVCLIISLLFFNVFRIRINQSKKLQSFSLTD